MRVTTAHLDAMKHSLMANALGKPSAYEPALVEAAQSTLRRQRVIFFSVAAALGGFLFGYDTAVINGAVAAVQQHYQAGPFALGAAIASALIGSAIGAWFAGQIADRIGRVRTMLIASALFIVGSIGTGFAISLVDFSAWRIVGGLAVGIASVIAPAYIAEISPAELRGRLASLQQLAIVLGIFVSLLADFAIAGVAGSAQGVFLLGTPAWRVMFWAEVIPAALYGFLALRIAESPRYLVQRGRDAEARVVLGRLQGGNVSAKIDDIRKTVKIEAHPRLKDLLNRRFGLLPVVWIGIALSVFQQLVGINVIFYYSSVLWASVGFSQQSSLLITVITSVTNVATTFIAIALVDRIGRKPLLLAGSAGMAITLGVLAFLFGTAPLVAGLPHLGPIAGPIALVAANLYVVAFGFSWGPVVWVLLGEMFPNRIRAIAVSVAAAAQWLANFAVSTSFPPLQHLGLGFAYGLYTAAALLSIVFVWFFVRETKGKELETM
jgi:sugar porter (SP) family MFS transporter